MRRSEMWPPAVAMGAIAMLFVFVLPNPLRVPQNNPSAQAEYAPVPGENEDNADANFGETGQATSDGAGSGGSEVEEPPPGMPPKIEIVWNPRHKQCFGPKGKERQLPDPLSPWCVAFFDGDNGGSTHQGVTADEILIVYYNDFGVKGDLTEPYKSSDDRPVAYPEYYYRNHVRTVKAQLRYFSNHFQTYGRRVRMIGYASPSGLGTTDAGRVSDITKIAGMKPFAVVTLIENAQKLASIAKEFKIPIFGWNKDVPLQVYQDNAPYIWSFTPDQTTETRWSAGFICRKLADRPARFTDDPLLNGKPRKFGLLFQNPSDSQRGPFLAQLAEQLVNETKRQCGLEFEAIRMFDRNGDSQTSTIMADWKRREVTTVVCYCIAQQNELHVPKFQSAATGLSYFPEWYWDSTAAMDRALWQREYGNPSHKSFGSSYLWRQGPFNQTYAYRAFQSQEPGQVPNLRFNIEMYHTFLSLFSGLQGAGRTLTPETIEMGMRTFFFNDPSDPYTPTGGYTPEGGATHYTFIHTAMAWWYDPAGTPPGRSEPDGCIRVLYKGQRFYGQDWPRGDADLFQPSNPCTEDTRRDR